MEKRVQLSRKTRFEVFKRDDFTCQYCGRKTPSVILEVDHITPVFEGGNNDIDNLITSCFDCNRGKGKNSLTSIPQSLQEKHNIAKEKELQYKEYNKLRKQIEKRILSEINEVAETYTLFFPNYELSEQFKKSAVKKFIDKLGVVDVVESMESACGRMNHSRDAVKYFCGICWSKIKNNE